MEGHRDSPIHLGERGIRIKEGMGARPVSNPLSPTNYSIAMKAYIEPHEAAKLEEATTNLRDRLLVRLSFHTGCRITEALGLEVNDLDFNQGTVRIQHLKSRIKLNCPQCGAGLGKSHAYCPRCGSKVDKPSTRQQEFRKVTYPAASCGASYGPPPGTDGAAFLPTASWGVSSGYRMRTLPVDADTMKLLLDYVNRGGPVTKGDRLLIFGINRHRAWQIVKKCAEKADLPKLLNPETGKMHNVSPHKLRDAFAVNAMKLDDSGDGLRLLQEHLGHASFNTTARYRKVSGKEHRVWYDKLWMDKASGESLLPVV